MHAIKTFVLLLFFNTFFFHAPVIPIHYNEIQIKLQNKLYRWKMCTKNHVFWNVHLHGKWTKDRWNGRKKKTISCTLSKLLTNYYMTRWTRVVVRITLQQSFTLTRDNQLDCEQTRERASAGTIKLSVFVWCMIYLSTIMFHFSLIYTDY